MSSVSKFIRYPIETNPTTLAEAVYAYIQARAAQWSPNDGALDVWIIQGLTAIAAELRELATDVPTDIFRYYGASLIGLPPLDDTPSTVSSTWAVINTAGYTIPAGTQVGIRDSAGNIVPFEVVTSVVIPPGSAATAAGGVTLRSSGTGAATAGLAGVGANFGDGYVTLLDVLDFVTNVTLTGVTTGGVDAEDDDVYLDRLATRLRLLSTRPVLPADFATLARDIAGVYRVVAIDLYNPIHNLLTANQSDAETDASGWQNSGNANVNSTAAQARSGAKSVGMTSIAAGDMSAGTPATALTGVPVTPGETITGLVSIRSAAVVRSCRAVLYWYTAAGAFISTSLGAAANDSSAAWVDYAVTGTAPATAAFVVVAAYVTGTAAAGEVHYADRASIRRGAATDYIAGGTPELNNARMLTIAAVDTLGNNVSGTIKTAIDTLLQTNREVNFIVNTMDPNRNLVDVNYAAKALPGFSTVAVKAAVDANLAAYLNAATWGTEVSGDPRDWVERTVLRYSDVAAIISNTEGVDYWTSLTIGIHGNALAAADLPLPGPAALAILSTIGGAGVT